MGRIVKFRSRFFWIGSVVGFVIADEVSIRLDTKFSINFITASSVYPSFFSELPVTTYLIVTLRLPTTMEIYRLQFRRENCYVLPYTFILVFVFRSRFNAPVSLGRQTSS